MQDNADPANGSRVAEETSVVRRSGTDYSKASLDPQTCERGWQANVATGPKGVQGEGTPNLNAEVT